jgi:hypothetical protein
LPQSHDARPAAARRAVLVGALAAAALAPACVSVADILLGSEEEPPSPDRTILPPAGDDDFVILQGRDPAAPGEAGAPGAPGSTAGTPHAGTGGRDPAAPAGEGPGAVAIAGLGLLALVSAALTAVGTGALWRTLHAWGSPEVARSTGFGSIDRAPTTSFSLLVPARHDERALGPTLDRLAMANHPHVEVLAVVGHDDPGTRRVAVEAAVRHPGRLRVVVDRNFRKGKAGMLDAALGECRGEVVGVFEPGDEVHPQLLRHVDARLAATGAAAVQGGVHLVGVRGHWSTLHHVVDRWFWFRSRLHSHAGQRFTPLSGTTAFVRTDVLRASGGWDDDCLAEGTELGVRLSVEGTPVTVAYDPQLATRTRGPDDLRGVVAAHAVWLQGFLQVLRRGVWRRLPGRRQRLRARYTLAQPLLEALVGAVVPLGLALAVVTGAPLGVVALAALPAVPAVTAAVVEAVGLGEMARAHGTHARARDRVLLLAGALPHRLLLGLAAVRAVVRQVRGVDGSEAATPDAGRPLPGHTDPDAGRPLPGHTDPDAGRPLPGHTDPHVVHLPAGRRSAAPTVPTDGVPPAAGSAPSAGAVPR